MRVPSCCLSSTKPWPSGGWILHGQPQRSWPPYATRHYSGGWGILVGVGRVVVGVVLAASPYFLLPFARSVFYVSSDHRGGAIHVSPNVTRAACAAYAPLRARFEADFSSCSTVGTTPCDCGTDAEVGQLAGLPQFAFHIGAWLVAQGAETLHGQLCAGLVAQLQTHGLGVNGGDATANSTGFYRMAACTRAGGPAGDADAGLAQRVSFFTAAAAHLLTPVTPALSTASVAVSAMPVTVTASFSQGVRVDQVGTSSITSGNADAVLGAWTAVDASGNIGARFTFTVNMSSGFGRIPLSIERFAAPAALADVTNNEARAALNITYEDPALALHVVLTSQVQSPATDRSIQFTATFSHALAADLTAAGVQVSSGGTVFGMTAVQPLREYTFSVRYPDPGTVAVSIASAAVDSGTTGSPNHASNAVTFTYDPPACAACAAYNPCLHLGVCYAKTNGLCPGGTTWCEAQASSGFVNGTLAFSDATDISVQGTTYSNPVFARFTLSEAVVETPVASTFSASSGTVTNVARVDATTISLAVTDPSEGTLTIGVPAGGLTSVRTGEGLVEPKPISVTIGACDSMCSCLAVRAWLCVSLSMLLCLPTWQLPSPLHWCTRSHTMLPCAQSPALAKRAWVARLATSPALALRRSVANAASAPWIARTKHRPSSL